MNELFFFFSEAKTDSAFLHEEFLCQLSIQINKYHLRRHFASRELYFYYHSDESQVSNNGDLK